MGYTGGENPHPSYASVCQGDGHTEAVRVEYDPLEISYEELLDAYWNAYQGPGSLQQYRAYVWYHNEEQQRLAKKSLKEVRASGRFMDFMVTDIAIQVVPARPWHDAEDYHQHHLYGHTEGCKCLVCTRKS